jgi:hypothetical protein
MRIRLALASALVLGCASAETQAPAAPTRFAASGPTVVAAQVEPAKNASAGWPSARDGSDAIETPADDAPAPITAARCVTPDAIRGGDAQPDLRLEVRGPKTLAKGEFPELKGSIHNGSRRRAHAIVLPGDGSDAGWRDPVIAFTAFIDEGDGCWKPLARAATGRCGLFDADWSDEIVTVAAGTTRSLDPMWSFPAFEWRKGNVRLFVHYTWTGGTASKGGGSSSVDLGAMAKERPYELVSNAIEIRVTG